jgi:hypothetical protein
MKFDAQRQEEERSEGLIFRKKYTVYIGEYTVTLDDDEVELFEKLLQNDGGRDSKKSKNRQYEYNTDERYFLGMRLAYQGPKDQYNTGGGLEALLRHGTWLWDLYDNAKQGKESKIKIVAKSPGDRENWEVEFIENYKKIKQEAEMEYRVSSSPENESIEV